MDKNCRDSKKFKYLIGIDEAGRGPLAGPVAVGAVAWEIGQHSVLTKKFGTIKESKQLSPAKREYWYRLMLAEKQKGNLNFACAYSSNTMIDKRGLSWAIRSALARALGSLEKIKRPSGSFNFPENSRVLLDGGLKAPVEYVDQTTIIKGDEKEMVIAMASIVAKVRRDRLVKKWSEKYPGYGFEAHVGYGTTAHYQALSKLGPSPIHRLSFLPNKD